MTMRSEEEIRERLRMIRFFIKDLLAHEPVIELLDGRQVSTAEYGDGRLQMARNDERVLEWVLGEDENSPPRDLNEPDEPDDPLPVLR
jgi:hypothetical protein